MKIAVNAQWYQADQHTGIGTYTEHLYKNIWQLDKEHQYVFFSKNPSEDLIRSRSSKIEFRKAIGIDDNKYYRFIWENIALPVQINRMNPDIIHSLNYSMPWMIMPRLKKIVTVYDLIWMKFPEFFAKDTVYMAQKRLRYSCQAADKIITISKNTKRDILENCDCDESKIRVIHLGIDPERFEETDRDELAKSSVGDKYKLPNDFILWVGGFRKSKNVDRLCRAFIKVKERLDCPHQLVLCGHKTLEYQRIRAMLQEYEEFFVFTGAVEDSEMPILYNLAQAFVFPSLYEGFGLPVLEAMACGTPVITSNSSSLPEVAGDAAILVNPEDEEGIADAIMRLIASDSLRESLRKKGLERAKLFTWEDTARKTLKLFKEVAG